MPIKNNKEKIPKKKKHLSYKKLQKRRLPYEVNYFDIDSSTEFLREQFGHICKTCSQQKYCRKATSAAVLICNRKTEKPRKNQPN